MTYQNAINDVLRVLANKLNPEVNKIRLVRELLMGNNPDLEGMIGEPRGSILSGLHDILAEFTQAYDKAHNKIERMELNTKTEGQKLLEKNKRKLIKLKADAK